MSIDFHGFYAVLAPTRTHKKTVFGTVTSAPTQKRFGIVFGNHHSCPQDAMHKTNILGGWRNQLGQYFFDMLYRAVDRSQLGPCRHHIFVHIDSKTSSLLQKIQSVYFVPWPVVHIEYAHDEHHRSPSLYVSPEPVGASCPVASLGTSLIKVTVWPGLLL